MFLETVKSEGLSHLSYVIGDGGTAAVIDPRRDIEAYLDIADQQSVRISHIFETHRNEDYVIGSQELAARTGATVYHGRAAGASYWQGVGDGDCFTLGKSVRLCVLETPGHTLDSISLVLYDVSWSEDTPVGVFTGDALFIGDVGRTDFYPGRRDEVSNMLYDSLHEKLLPLGDHVLLYPAHGAGSVCGSGMAKREFSSIGYELRSNSLLSNSRQEFVKQKVNEHHYQPGYFRRMEKLNQEGAPVLGALPRPPALGLGRFGKLLEDGAQLVDVREPVAYGGASIPGSLSLPLDLLAGFAGYFLDYEKPILLLGATVDQVRQAVPLLVRMDYVKLAGYLAGGLSTWAKAARPLQRIPLVHVDEVQQRLSRRQQEAGEPVTADTTLADSASAPSSDAYTLLDVRRIDEYRSKRLRGALHIYVGDLPERLDDVPRNGTITTFCGSGRRAMIAASLLKRAGFERVENNLGSMSAASSAGLQMESD